MSLCGPARNALARAGSGPEHRLVYTLLAFFAPFLPIAPPPSLRFPRFPRFPRVLSHHTQTYNYLTTQLHICLPTQPPPHHPPPYLSHLFHLPTTPPLSPQ
jgi:hypothetical protein